MFMLRLSLSSIGKLAIELHELATTLPVLHTFRGRLLVVDIFPYACLAANRLVASCIAAHSA